MPGAGSACTCSGEVHTPSGCAAGWAKCLAAGCWTTCLSTLTAATTASRKTSTSTARWCVRGGVIAFHGIAEHPQEAGCQVAQFWNEVKPQYRHSDSSLTPTRAGAASECCLLNSHVRQNGTRAAFASGELPSPGCTRLPQNPARLRKNETNRKR